MHCDALIIGGGFYGLRLAEWAAGRFPRVALTDLRGELMQHASFNNQTRVHNGYHCPPGILSRVLEETSDRPVCYVRDGLSSAVVLTDPARRSVLDRTEDQRAQPASLEV